MYRQYEDPYKLEGWLREAEADLEKARYEDDLDRQIDLYDTVEALKARINYAWQDDEYDRDYGSY